MSSSLYALVVAAVAGLSLIQEAPQASKTPELIKPALSPTSQPTTRILPPRNKMDTLVTVGKGTIPIILSAPHGGTMDIPGSDRRTGANIPKKRGAKNNFTVAFDRNVDYMALRIADEIEKRTGNRPYIVVANFKRTFADANRNWADAYESEAAGKAYDEYHSTLTSYRNEIIRNWRRGLLLDIHGHGGDRDVLIRGTADGASVTHLVEEFGREGLTGPDGFLGPIEAAGFKIRPANIENDVKEVASLNGGFITRNYGSFAGGSFDSVQWELGGNYRTAEGIDKFAPVAAEAIIKFYSNYLIEGQGKLADIESTAPAAAAFIKAAANSK